MTLSRRNFLRLSSGAVALGVIPRGGSSSSLGIGLVGAGEQGLRLLHALNSRQGQIRLVGVCDVSQSALTSVKQYIPSLRTTQDYRELLSWSDIQAVIIATPDFSHTPLALTALETGKDVYLEIPLTRTLEEFESLQRAAHDAGRLLFPGETSLSHAGYTLTAEYIRAGLIGRVSRIHITKHLVRPVPPQINEAAVAWESFLLYLAPRPFDANLYARWQERYEGSDGVALAQLAQSAGIVQRMMGLGQPTRIAVHGGVYVSDQRRDTPDTLYALLEYAEGCVVNFSAFPGDASHDVFSLYGTRGTLDVQQMRFTTESAIETPISEAMAQQATHQLMQAAQSVNPLERHLARWLEALQTRNVPPDILNHATEQLRLGQRAATAYRT